VQAKVAGGSRGLAEWAFAVEASGEGFAVEVGGWRLVVLLLLVKDLDYLSKLYESSPFFFNELPSCFGLLGNYLPSSYTSDS
jgi:hypothetical protein